MVKLLTVDSGTTNTRLRLVEDGRVIQSFQAQAGARDGPDAIAAALSSLLRQAQSTEAQAVMFSGMITSPTGLIEIPHVAGPLSLERLRPLRHDFPQLSRLPFYFIPGVRIGEAGASPAFGDIIRGEETELAGYLALHGPEGRRLCRPGPWRRAGGCPSGHAGRLSGTNPPCPALYRPFVQFILSRGVTYAHFIPFRIYFSFCLRLQRPCSHG